ncbi:hypothetical protein SAMN05216559_0290 [Halomicrobium zhouii]|uniref:DUF7982 domain-containing protein n=1 Tax=Halomicrobium zhouii TaxID=767519 RepID=A0A1I6K743_9EURY|nr:hypothetical protein [Halomicrobium zhouii]SFR86974.1 hypothetical protein SAMN05216559_0290 [Halomicrobium zhouii]
MSSETPATDPEAQPNEPPASADEPSADDASPEEPDRETLLAELERQRAEADRLRESYVRARRSQYRRTALGFAVLGALATAGGVLFPETRTVLLALGGTGLFAALLTWFVTPERFVSADVGDAVYEALARNQERLCLVLGLSEERVYVPTGSIDERSESIGVRLYVPQREKWTLPGADALESLFVVTGDAATRGVSLEPTGETLFREFEAALGGPLASDPPELVGQVREAVVEQFEIAGALRTDLDLEGGRLTLDVTDGAYGSIARFDHPVVSTVAVALARGLNRPVTVELDDADGEAVATLRWDVERSADSDGTENGDETE